MRRSTTVLLVLAVAMAGVYYLLKNREKPADIAVTLEPGDVVSYLFSADSGVPSEIRIESKDGAIVDVSKGADNSWSVKQPFEAAADQGMVEAAVSQITTMRVLDTLPDIDLDVVGLKVPEYKLAVTFADGERNVSIGVITPTGTGYYVLTPDAKVVIVSSSAVEGLLNLLKSPPYLETLTPSPTATETPIEATPEPATATPTTTTP